MQLTDLKTDFLGRKFIFYDEIDSTQSEIWRLVENNEIKNGTLIMADIQTQGKGTHGRIWHTDEAKNIAFSFYIDTNCFPEKLDGITIEIAKILVDIFRENYGINLNIKEPNDITYNNKKIGGILTESRINSGKVKFLVVGIGLNTVKMAFPEDIKDIATSIKKEFGIEVDRMEIIAEFCNKFERLIKDKIKCDKV